MSAHPRSLEFSARQPDRLCDVGEIGFGFEWAQAAQVGWSTERFGHHRPTTGLHLDAEADGVQRYHDVGEDDRGIDAIAPHRLEGQLGGQ